MQAWDKILYEKPKEVLDSLETRSHQELSKKNRAYYSLLITIARNKSDITEKDDSTISFAVDWYIRGKDYKNICRSLLYRGIVINKINYRDSLLYYNLKEAEKIFYKRHVEDSDFESQIYTALGRTYLVNKIYSPGEITIDRTYKIPEEYFIKSIKLNNRLNNQKEVQKAKLELFNIHIQQKRDKEALDILNSFGNPDSLPQDIKFGLYKAYESYYSYSGLRDLKKSTEYLKKIIDIRKSTNKSELSISFFYGRIASNFLKAGKPDSTLLYYKLALKSAEENDEKTFFAYYIQMAKTFASIGDYKSAYENSKKAMADYTSTITKTDNKALKKTREDLNKMTSLQAKEERENNILLILLLVLLISFSWIIFISRKNRMVALKEQINCQNNIAILDDELKKTKFINLLHETLVGALPKLIDDVNKQANRSRKFSSELSDDLNDSINSVRSHTKSNLSVITHSKAFLIANPNVKHLFSLSDMEIIILVLFDLKFSSKEIADLLNTTQSSVRAIKARIKEKILSTEGLPFDPESTFLIFSKDQNQRI